MNQTATSSSAVSLDDSALTQHLTKLVRHERRYMVEFLRHLAEFGARKLYLGLGYSSLFVYLRDCLRFSKGSSYRRFSVARLMARFPVIAELLDDGRLNLKRIAMLDGVLTVENHLDVLTRATLGTEDDVKVLVATLKPKPDVTDSVRKAPERIVTSAPSAPETTATTQQPASTARSGSAVEPAPRCGSTVEPAPKSTVPASEAQRSTQAGVAAAQDAQRRPETADSLFGGSTVEPRVERPKRMEVEPTSATAFCVRMRVGPEFLAEFEAVKSALSHKFPDGNFEDVLRECFRLTLEVTDRRRAAKTRRCGTTSSGEPTQVPVPVKVEPPGTHSTVGEESCGTKPPQRSRYVPAAVRRAVWKRDEGACAFVSADGKRCASRHQLELHHLDPFARGGASTEQNLSLRCRVHNAYEAEQAYGSEFMRTRTGAKRRPSGRQDTNPSREPRTDH